MNATPNRREERIERIRAGVLDLLRQHDSVRDLTVGRLAEHLACSKSTLYVDHASLADLVLDALAPLIPEDPALMALYAGLPRAVARDLLGYPARDGRLALRDAVRDALKARIVARGEWSRGPLLRLVLAAEPGGAL